MRRTSMLSRGIGYTLTGHNNKDVSVYLVYSSTSNSMQFQTWQRGRGGPGGPESSFCYSLDSIFQWAVDEIFRYLNTNELLHYVMNNEYVYDL